MIFFLANGHGFPKPTEDQSCEEVARVVEAARICAVH